MKHVRVSEILAQYTDYKDVDPEVMKEKSDIGTSVHNCIVKDCAGEFYVLKNDRAQAYFDSYKIQFPKNPIIRQVPRLYCDKLMITGECDGLWQENGPDMLIDWKCSFSAHEKIWEMQAHFYYYLLKENGYSLCNKMFWYNLKHEKIITSDLDKLLGRKATRKEQKAYIEQTGVAEIPFEVTYVPLPPKAHQFNFNEKCMQECIEAAIRFVEDKNNAKDVDCNVAEVI